MENKYKWELKISDNIKGIVYLKVNQVYVVQLPGS